MRPDVLEGIATFLRRVLLTSPHADEIHVLQQPRRGPDSEIHFLAIADPLDYAGEDKLLDLAQAIDTICEQDAQGQPGRFARYFLRADIGTRSLRSPIFKKDTADEEQAEGDDMRDDLTRQLLKGLNDAHRAIMTMGPGIAMAQAETIAHLTSQVREHEAGRVKTFEIVESLMTQSAEREAIARRELRKDKIVSRAVDSFFPLVHTAVGQKLYGKKLPPHIKNSPQFLALNEAVKGIPPEKLMQFLSGLEPGVALALVSALQGFAEGEKPDPDKQKEKVADVPRQLEARSSGTGFF